ncbi:MAG: purine-nucleoside phosphorylase [Clostridia bacterium]|nr:purine-nucleoside phosphorylase [Clostridia bacterium]
MQDILSCASEASRYISERISVSPKIGIILGSGLGKLADEVKSQREEISYADIPHFPKSTVEGHSGRIITGKIYDKEVIIMQGRFHYYEGYDLSDVTFPIVVFGLLGVSELIVTNAAGGITKRLLPTDLMLITDHINFANISPLRGPHIELFGERFPSMSEAYSLRLRNIAKEASSGKEYDTKIDLKEGIYAYMTGPQYETPAEVKMLEILGADAVGMSTVPEVIMARQLGMDVLGISCITNNSNVSVKEPSHEEVIENADKASDMFIQLIMRILRKM